ncbi:hypothetical protein BX666DRAFT_535773 [Dichotomocladium elegans]|nr:hypothetical protein BX666DRAFT_535773 [Dichotomocladium elegans]
MTMTEKFIEIHQIMMNYPGAIQDHLVSKPMPDPVYELPLYERQRPRPLRDWFLGSKASAYWETVTTSLYLTLNPVGRMLMVLALGGCVAFLTLDMILKKRQVQWWRLWKRKQGDAAAAWAGYDPVATRELYYQSMTYLTLATVVQSVSLQGFGPYSLRMGDILPNTLYSSMLSAVAIEAVSLRLRKSWQVLLTAVVLLTAATAGLYRLRDITYGGPRSSVPAWIHGKNLQPALGDTAVWSLDLPGKIEPYRYTVGEEDAAEQEMTSLVRASYSKALKVFADSTRYHAVLPTTGPNEDDVRNWQAEVQKAALKRLEKLEEEAKMKQKEEEEKKKKEEEEEERAENANKDDSKKQNKDI